MLWVQIHYNSGLNLNCNEIIPFSKEWEWKRERERERESGVKLFCCCCKEDGYTSADFLFCTTIYGSRTKLF